LFGEIYFAEAPRYKKARRKSDLQREMKEEECYNPSKSYRPYV